MSLPTSNPELKRPWYSLQPCDMTSRRQSKQSGERRKKTIRFIKKKKQQQRYKEWSLITAGDRADTASRDDPNVEWNAPERRIYMKKESRGSFTSNNICYQCFFASFVSHFSPLLLLSDGFVWLFGWKEKIEKICSKPSLSKGDYCLNSWPGLPHIGSFLDVCWFTTPWGNRIESMSLTPKRKDMGISKGTNQGNIWQSPPAMPLGAKLVGLRRAVKIAQRNS